MHPIRVRRVASAVSRRSPRRAPRGGRHGGIWRWLHARDTGVPQSREGGIYLTQVAYECASDRQGVVLAIANPPIYVFAIPASPSARRRLGRKRLRPVPSMPQTTCPKPRLMVGSHP